MYLSRLVIAFGPGRCGSKSFATLMNIQRGVQFYHELYRMSWELDVERIDLFVMALHHYGYNGTVGDFGNWYLQYLDVIFDAFKEKARFIYLYRDIDEVVDSYMRKVVNGNHWTARWSSHWDGSKPSIFDQCYPKYDLPKEDAVRKYCHDYHEIAKLKVASFPNNARIFDLELFESEGIQKRLFEFIGVKEYQIHLGICENRGYTLKNFIGEFDRNNV